MNYKKDEATDLLKKLGIELKHEDQDKDGKALLKVKMMCIFYYAYVIVYLSYDDN